MALGSNRDYVKTHKATVAAIKKRGWLKLWECPGCGRKNLESAETCPRCGAERKNDEKD